MTIQKWKLNSLLVFTLLLFGQPIYSQSKSQLKKKKAKIQTEIRKLNGLLGETRTNKRKSEIQLLILSKKIGARKDLISAIGNEVSSIDKEIKVQNYQIQNLKSKLLDLRNQYTKMVEFAYKNRNATNKLIFIFSSEDFNQAYKRVKYLHEIAEHRIYQSQQIKLATERIEEKIMELEEKKFRKLNLKEHKKLEFNTLQEEQGERQNLYVELRKDEKQLKTNLEKKKKRFKEVTSSY
jgi:septal ring factor EnvC (AmiA/AmiB activator)